MLFAALVSLSGCVAAGLIASLVRLHLVRVYSI